MGFKSCCQVYKSIFGLKYVLPKFHNSLDRRNWPIGICLHCVRTLSWFVLTMSTLIRKLKIVHRYIFYLFVNYLWAWRIWCPSLATVEMASKANALGNASDQFNSRPFQDSRLLELHITMGSVFLKSHVTFKSHLLL